MKRLTWIVLSTLLPLLTLQAGNIDWSDAIKDNRDKVVVIEYYEQLNSVETIVDKGRVKRYLTGIIVDDSGLILTSSSIFKPNLEFSTPQSFYNSYQLPSDIRVKMADGRYIPAQFVGKDDDKRLAFIRLKTKEKIEPVEFSAKHNLQLGSPVLIIQHLPNRYDSELMVSKRMINAVLKQPFPRFLCENNISSLSDFGLVLNAKQEPVAIIRSSGYNSVPSFGFDDGNGYEPMEIIPYEQFKELIKNPPVFKKKETKRKKWLGIYMQPFTRKMAAYFGQDSLSGILINTIFDKSPAQKAGLQIGDVLTRLDGRPLKAEEDKDLEEFRRIVREHESDKIVFTVFRNGRFLDISVTLGEAPISSYLADELSNALLGFSAKELTQDIIIAKQLEYDTEGVWVSKVERAGWADVAGLQVGDLLLKINEKKISALSDLKTCFEKIERDKPEYISLFIKRGSETRFLFLKTNF